MSKVRPKNKKICIFEGCGRPRSANGLCQTHRKMQRNGLDLRPLRCGKIGENNPKWRGGVRMDGHGRTLIYSPNHPYPNFDRKYVYRYRLVVESSIGRYLKPSEIVHHINGDQSDDRLENLEVMTQADHVRSHHKEMIAARKLKHGY